MENKNSTKHCCNCDTGNIIYLPIILDYHRFL